MSLSVNVVVSVQAVGGRLVAGVEYMVCGVVTGAGVCFCFFLLTHGWGTSLLSLSVTTWKSALCLSTWDIGLNTTLARSELQNC